MMLTIAFGLVAAVLLLSALMVVRAENLVHGVLWLGVTLLGTAALYALLDASFLAGAQILVYVGGVVTLMIFGVMLTRRHDGLSVPAEQTSSGRGVALAAALFGVLAAALGRSQLGGLEPSDPATTERLAAGLLGPHLLAFEALSLLLLAAIIGALVVARKRDPGAPARPGRPGARGPLERQAGSWTERGASEDRQAQGETKERAEARDRGATQRMAAAASRATGTNPLGALPPATRPGPDAPENLP